MTLTTAGPQLLLVVIMVLSGLGENVEGVEEPRGLVVKAAWVGQAGEAAHPALAQVEQPHDI